MPLQRSSGSCDTLQQCLTVRASCQNLSSTFANSCWNHFSCVCRGKNRYLQQRMWEMEEWQESTFPLSSTCIHTHRQACPTAIKISAEGRRFLRMIEVTVLGTYPASPPAGPCCMRTSWLILLHTLKLGALQRRGCSFCPTAAEMVPHRKRKWGFSDSLTFPFPAVFKVFAH